MWKALGKTAKKSKNITVANNVAGNKKVAKIWSIEYVKGAWGGLCAIKKDLCR